MQLRLTFNSLSQRAMLGSALDNGSSIKARWYDPPTRIPLFRPSMNGVDCLRSAVCSTISEFDMMEHGDGTERNQYVSCMPAQIPSRQPRIVHFSKEVS